jgi:hypothetical protein
MRRALVFLVFFYLRKLDGLPRADCCGCSCHTRARYAGAIAAAPGPRPQHGGGGGITEPDGWAGSIFEQPAGRKGGDLEAGGGGAPPAAAAPVPVGAGWEEEHVVAELVVRAPSGARARK